MRKITTAAAITAALGLSLLATTAQPQPGFRGPRAGNMQHRPPGPPPIIAALDANRDGTIDATEIANAGAALAALDKNADGSLTAEEFMGGPPPGEGGSRPPLPKELLDQYDADKDGQLSEAEREALHKDIESGKIQPPRGPRGPKGPPPQELMQKYDLDQDGQLSAEERQALDNDVQQGKVPRPGRPMRGPAQAQDQ